MRIFLLILKRIYKKRLPKTLYKLNINNTQRDCN